MLNKLITHRKSIRAFENSSIDDETVYTLFEAARKAPSSFNEQPWRFIAASKENGNSFNLILDSLNEKNKEWAKNAPLLVAALAKKELSVNRNPNKYFMYDTASAVMNLTLQATSLNLYVHQMGGFSPPKIKENFLVPDEFEPVVVLAIGFKGDPNTLPENLRTDENSESKRKPLEALLFENQFGESHSILLNDKEKVN